MCYNISYLTKKKLDYARKFKEAADIADLEKILDSLFKKAGPTYHTSGFDHPDVPVITNTNPEKIQLFSWGLIPHWVRDSKQAVELSNKTINARGEEMFDKPSFKVSARKKRCLVIVDGFFEYHWKDDKSYPFYITLKSGEPMVLAGIWETWINKIEEISRNTFSIVTTRANSVLQYIHNKPKGSEGPRMPVILPQGADKSWLSKEVSKEEDIKEIKSLLLPFNPDELEAYTVGRLRGKNALGNTSRALEKVDYPELR